MILSLVMDIVTTKTFVRFFYQSIKNEHKFYGGSWFYFVLRNSVVALLEFSSVARKSEGKEKQIAPPGALLLVYVAP